MKKVLILHGFTTEYRIPFLKELNRILLENNISMKVVVGQPSKYEKYDKIETCDFFIFVRNTYIYFNKSYLIWEPVLSYLKGNDLVIMRQAKRHLVNPFVYFSCILSNKKTALWGNMKSYIFKKAGNQIFSLNNKVDHWFAYNDLTKKIVESIGFPSEKITSVHNSIDTKSERAIYNSITDEEIGILRAKYGIETSDIVGLFCSRLYSDKRIDFLLHSITKVKEDIPNFKFFVVGDGLEYNKILEFSKMNQEWFFAVGAQYGRNKIKYFKLSNFQLIPGLVGLHIVDSFAFECPIITTINTFHSVEIDYLKNGENGVMSEDSLEEYVNSIINVCKNKKLYEFLKVGCRESAKLYTIENMAQRFANGIISCLYEQPNNSL